MVSRNDICRDLNIDSSTLEKYLSFMAYPEPKASDFSLNLTRAVEKLHDLTKQGFSLNEVRDLIHCAEKFCHVVPSLKEFLQLSESLNLRETITSYNDAFNEFSAREEQYQTRVRELEYDIRDLKSQVDRANILEEQSNHYKNDMRELKELLNEKELYISRLEMAIAELETENSDYRYEITKRKNELEDLRDDSKFTNFRNKSAIDVDALLKRKEKEVSLKYQREIVDLKKQVEFMLENQEQKWLKRNLDSKISSK